MIRLTEKEFAKLRKKRSGSETQPVGASRLSRPDKGRAARLRGSTQLSEADLTKQCVGLMEAHGWKAVRLQRGLMRRRNGSVAMTIGEKGMCDWLFMKRIEESDLIPGKCKAWFCEFKAPGKKPSQAQLIFMADCWDRTLTAKWFDNYATFAEFVRLTFGVK